MHGSQEVLNNANTTATPSQVMKPLGKMKQEELEGRDMCQGEGAGAESSGQSLKRRATESTHAAKGEDPESSQARGHQAGA